MWFLNEYFIVIALFAVGVSVIKLISYKLFNCIKRYLYGLLFCCFLFVYSVNTAVFVVAMLAVNFALAKIIFHSKSGKKVFFVTGLSFNILLFFVVHFLKITDAPFMSMIGLIGFSYAILKLIDIMYYAYFFEQNIKMLDYASYMFFVPTFTSGPIINYNDFQKQIISDKKNFNFGMPVKRIIVGFFKKIVLVDLVYRLHDFIMPTQLNTATSILLLFLFYIIGYFDFSGYSDIAIGLGLLFGFEIPENFNKPFTSPSLTIFWRNWHMSLGNWIKTHVTIFIKLKSRFISALISFFIMVIVGLWHNFSVPFLLWGALHGIVLFFENIFNIGIVNKKKTKKYVYFLRCLLTNIIISFGCLFFYDSSETILKVFKGLLNFNF